MPVAHNPPKLHLLDLELCEYVVKNVASLHRRAGTRKLLEEDLIEGSPLLDHLRRVAEHEAASDVIPPPESGSPIDDSRSGPQKLLLTHDDLLELAEATRSSSQRWEYFPYIHKESVRCTREISTQLSPVDAAKWTEKCDRWITVLERPGTRLGAGVKTVTKWIKLVRYYLDAIGQTTWLPRPEGDQPTLGQPERAGASAQTHDTRGFDDDDLARVRAAIEELRATGSGEDPPEKAVRKAAGMNKQRVGTILRYLEGLGEYHGFARAPRTKRKQP